MISDPARTRTLSMVSVAETTSPARSGPGSRTAGRRARSGKRQLQLRVVEHLLPGRRGDHRGEGGRGERSVLW